MSSPAVLRVTNQTCILLPETLRKDNPVAIEPRTTVPSDMPAWIDCNIVVPDPEGYITIQNTTHEPVLLGRHTQVCQVRPTAEIIKGDDTSPQVLIPVAGKTKSKVSDACYSTPSTIKVDPSNVLSKPDQARLHQIHKTYEPVFTTGVGCYNGHSGRFSHVINVGSKLPPQRRGRIHIYNRGDMEKLQETFDELLEAGVPERAEDIGHRSPEDKVKKRKSQRFFGKKGKMYKPQ